MLFVSLATYSTKKTTVEFMFTQSTFISTSRSTEALLTSSGVLNTGRRKIEVLLTNRNSANFVFSLVALNSVYADALKSRVVSKPMVCHIYLVSGFNFLVSYFY